MIPPFGFPSLTFRPLRYHYRGVRDWSGHIPFARDLVAALEPGIFVELGTHFGESYFAFCQAIQENGTPCTAFAVDTWRGDQHSGHYGPDVLEDVDQYNKSLYSSFSSLVCMSFDEAVARFQDQAIDLLHIDGYHTYEAVRHDFETWLPKLKPGAIVLFHDTAVRRDDFGVWRYWAELQKRYTTFEFRSHSGLGVVSIPGPRPERGVLELLFQKSKSMPARIRAYYDMCAVRLEHEKAKTGEYGDLYTQVFWRGAQEEFSESRSAKGYSSLGAARSAVRIHLPAISNAVTELRIDIADRELVLRIFQISLLAGSGSVIWRSSGDEFFGRSRNSGMQALTGRGKGKGTLVIVTDKDCSSLLAVEASWDSEIRGGAVMEILVQGVAEPARELSEVIQEYRLSQEGKTPQQLAEQREAETRQLSAALQHAEQLALERQEKLQEYDRALLKATKAAERAQQLVEERETETRQVSAALRRIEKLALERQEQLQEYDRALAEAKRLVSEREEQLREYDRGLEEAKRLVSEREAEVRQVSVGLQQAERLALERQEQLREYDRTLSQARKLFEQKEKSEQELTEALARAEQSVSEREAEVRQVSAALQQAERLSLEHQERLRELTEELERTVRLRKQDANEMADLDSLVEQMEQAQKQLQSQLDEIEASLSWRATSPFRALKRAVKPGSSRASIPRKR